MVVVQVWGIAWDGGRLGACDCGNIHPPNESYPFWDTNTIPII